MAREFKTVRIQKRRGKSDYAQSIRGRYRTFSEVVIQNAQISDPTTESQSAPEFPSTNRLHSPPFNHPRSDVMQFRKLIVKDLRIFKYKRMQIVINNQEIRQLLQSYYFLFMSSPSHRASPGRRRKEADLNERTFKFSPIKQFNQKLYTKDYFCHYSNAVYMGGMDCFKKLGHGIMLMDNGACAITCHSHDNMINHNVIFRDGSLTSLVIGIDKSKTVCFRTGPYLLYFKMSAKDVVEGIGYFVHYGHHKIFRLKFQNEDIAVKQRIVDIQILKKVFDQNDLTSLIEKNHANALKMEFELPDEIKCSRIGEVYVIGMVNPAKNQSYINGVCFKLNVRLQFIHFDVSLEERGYVKKNVVQVFGERHFQNGNYYIGEFKNDEFHGLGVLVYPKQKKWTYGEYEKGQLQKVLASSVNSESMTCQSAIRQIHEYSKPYIEFTIRLNPSEKWLFQMLKAIDQKDPYEHESIDYTNEQNKLVQNLNIVQEDYVSRRYELRTEQALKNLADKKRSPEKIVANKNSSREKLRRASKEKKGSKNQMAHSPETKKGKYLNGSITFAPQSSDQQDSEDRLKQPQYRSRSKQKLIQTPPAADQKNKAADHVETEQIKNEFRQPNERFQTHVSPEEETTIIRALTGDSMRTNSKRGGYDGLLSPLNRNTHERVLGGLAQQPYRGSRPDHTLLSSQYRRYDSPTRRNDVHGYSLADPTRAELRYGISPQRHLHGRYRHFRYLPEEDDDIYLYPRMSNRAYIRDHYRA